MLIVIPGVIGAVDRVTDAQCVWSGVDPSQV
jgi:hypothetical protein